MRADDPLQVLSGGDRRSVGASNRVAAQVRVRPELMEALVRGLESADPVLRMRCADAMEKATAGRLELLAPFKTKLLRDFSKIEQCDVRWHVAPMLARLPLSRAEEGAVVAILLRYTGDRSSIVKTMAMQALADIACRRPRWLPDVRRHVGELALTGTPAMKARGRKLLARLDEAGRG